MVCTTSDTDSYCFLRRCRILHNRNATIDKKWTRQYAATILPTFLKQCFCSSQRRTKWDFMISSLGTRIADHSKYFWKWSQHSYTTGLRGATFLAFEWAHPYLNALYQLYVDFWETKQCNCVCNHEKPEIQHPGGFTVHLIRPDKGGRGAGSRWASINRTSPGAYASCLCLHTGTKFQALMFLSFKGPPHTDLRVRTCSWNKCKKVTKVFISARCI